MFLIAKFFKQIITVLHSEISPKQIAAGAALGAIIGLSPLSTLITFPLLFLYLSFR